MGPKCDRIFISLSVVFTLTTLAAVGVLCWREFFVHRKDTTINKENLVKLYPGIFHIYETQFTFNNLVIQGYNTLRPVNKTFDDGKQCSFVCNQRTTTLPPITELPPVTETVPHDSTTYISPGRRRRRAVSASSNDIYHACCVSNVNFISPVSLHNVINVPRELVHLEPYRQVFKNDNCSQAIGCTGCTCMHQMELVTAVVYVSGYSKDTATSTEHIEIDFFYLPGCCKCVNGEVNNNNF